jgi:alkylhydroperoxidase family enzyme
VQAVLDFVSRIVATRGHVADEDLAAVRQQGFDDERIVEIMANTALNLFTNYFNHVAHTEIDFPVVKTGAVAAA